MNILRKIKKRKIRLKDYIKRLRSTCQQELSEFGRYYFVVMAYTREDRGKTGMQIRDAMEIAGNKSGLSLYIFLFLLISA